MSTTYTTRDEAIQREIIEPIEGTGEVKDARAEFDIDAIADETIEWDDDRQGFRYIEGIYFWDVAYKHAK